MTATLRASSRVASARHLRTEKNPWSDISSSIPPWLRRGCLAGPPATGPRPGAGQGHLAHGVQQVRVRNGLDRLDGLVHQRGVTPEVVSDSRDRRDDDWYRERVAQVPEAVAMVDR